MRVEDSYPAPVLGVSTLASRNRAKGMAGKQVNLRSDPVQKLTRRPPLQWDAFLLDTPNEVTEHSYYRRGKEYKLLIEDNGTVHGFVDNVSVGTSSLGAYGASTNLSIITINDTTFVVNKDTVVTMEADTDINDVNNVSHINVVSALNYGETVVVNVGVTAPYPATVSVTIGSAEDAVTSDVARRTNQVASDLAVGLNAAYAGLNAAAHGSSVAVWQDNNAPVQLTLSTGGGDDDVKIFNSVTESIEGLPLYARVGTRVTVQPDPSTEKGTYYLDAVSLSGSLTPIPNTPLEEVVWTETRAADEQYAITQNTMPHTIRYDYDTNTFISGVSETPWDDRLKGDDESCPRPKFIGRTITSIGQFQKRLVFLSDNDVEMTVTDNLYMWWKQSALQLLVTDPIGITGNSVGTDVIQHIVEHNRDLLAISSNGQFKIDGTVGVTPQTVSMPLTSAQEVQVSAEPITLGTSVFMPINYGQSTGLVEYTGARDSRDETIAVTDHVIGYMLGEADLLVGSPNLNMIAMTTTGGASNEIFIYEEFREKGTAIQKSWSKWTIPEDNKILGMSFRRDTLTLTIQAGTKIFSKSFVMYSRIANNTEEVLLNDFISVDSLTGDTIELPTEYPNYAEVIVVMGDGCNYPLFKAPYTRVGNTVTFDENISGGGACTVYVGSPYYSGYQPTRPFRLDDEGVAITTDRLRINRYRLGVVDTEEITMRTHAKYGTPADQTVTHRMVNRRTNKVGEINLFSGDIQFSYSQNADHADVEFFTEGWLGMTITSISWLGQYFQSSGRI